MILDRALAFIDRNKERPFFLYFASTLPHANNEARPNGMEIPDYGAYRDKNWPDQEKGQAAMISRLDSDVGRLMEKLRADGLEGRTVVFFSSDNGPHHEGGHDPEVLRRQRAASRDEARSLRGGHSRSADRSLAGPCPKGAVCGHVGYFGDFFATAAAIAGAACPAGLDSVSLLPSITGDDVHQAEHAYLYWEFYEAGIEAGGPTRALEGRDPPARLANGRALRFAD